MRACPRDAAEEDEFMKLEPDQEPTLRMRRPPELVFEKFIAAQRILHDCYGKKGVWASPDRYRYQCWTRDFVIALMEPVLERNEDLALRHVFELGGRQRQDGSIPIL